MSLARPVAVRLATPARRTARGGTGSSGSRCARSRCGAGCRSGPSATRSSASDASSWRGLREDLGVARPDVLDADRRVVQARRCAGTSSSARRAGRSSRPCRSTKCAHVPGSSCSSPSGVSAANVEYADAKLSTRCSARRSRADSRAATCSCRSDAGRTRRSRPSAAGRTGSVSRRSAASAERRARVAPGRREGQSRRPRVAMAGVSVTGFSRLRHRYVFAWSRASASLAARPARTSEAVPTPLPYVITATTRTPPGQ